ncbi:MAG TPA: TonB-dependent receptor, partial [Gemmatimonadales bacterium]|nr:TonB-dependent receptor [Gemmatimonadales bacterium]
MPSTSSRGAARSGSSSCPRSREGASAGRTTCCGWAGWQGRPTTTWDYATRKRWAGATTPTRGSPGRSPRSASGSEVWTRRSRTSYSKDLIKQPGSLPQFEVASNPRQNFTAGDFFAPQLNLAILNASYAITEHITLQGNAFVRALSSEQFNVNLIADNTRLRNRTLSTGGKLQASDRSTIFGRDNVLVVGGEYTRSAVKSRTFEEGVEGQALTANLKDIQNAVGVYAQDTFTLFRSFLGTGSSLILTAAGRWDYLQHDIADLLGGPSGGVFSFSRFNPRTGVNVNLNDRLGFFASYAEGFRAPAFLELTCAGPGAVCPGLQVGVAPDPPLKPVVARTW